MPDTATIGVLRDVVTFVLLALAVAAAAYHLMRRIVPMAQWNYSGNVLSRLYEMPDAILALFLLLPYIGSIYSDASVGGAGGHSAASPKIGDIILQITFILGMALVLVCYLRFIRGFDPSELFGVRNISVGKAVKLALAAIAPVFVVVSVVNSGASELLKGVWPDASPQEIVKAFETSGSVAVRLLMALAAVVIAPLTEELLFRGFLYGVCKRYTDSWFAAICTSLLFATVHLHVASFLPLFSLAMVLVFAYEMTGCLLVPMLIHGLFNGFMIVAMLLGAK